MQAERGHAVIAGLIVDGDATVIVGCIYVSAAWRSHVLCGSLWTVYGTHPVRKWTSGKLDVEGSSRGGGHIGHSLVLRHINDTCRTILSALAAVVGKADGQRAEALNRRSLLTRGQNDKQSQQR